MSIGRVISLLLLCPVLADAALVLEPVYDGLGEWEALIGVKELRPN